MTRSEQPAELAFERSEKSGTVCTNRFRRPTGDLGGSPANGGRTRRDWPRPSRDDEPTTIHVAITVCDDQGTPPTGLPAVGHATATDAEVPEAQNASQIRAWPGRVGSQRLTGATRAQPTPVLEAGDDDEPTNVSHGAVSRVRALCELAAAQHPIPRADPVQPHGDEDGATHLTFGTLGRIRPPHAEPATIPAEQRFPPLRVRIHTKSPPEKEPSGARRFARAISMFAGSVCAAWILSAILPTLARSDPEPPRSVPSRLVIAAPDTTAAAVVAPWAGAQPGTARVVPFDVAPADALQSEPAPSAGASDPSLPPIPYR